MPKQVICNVCGELREIGDAGHMYSNSKCIQILKDKVAEKDAQVEQLKSALRRLRDALSFLPMSWEEVCDEETADLVKTCLGETDEESEEE